MGSCQEASRQEIEIRDVEGERQRVVSGTGRRGCGGRGRGVQALAELSAHIGSVQGVGVSPP